MNNVRKTELLAIIREQQTVIERLSAEIAELKAQLAKNSRNSGKPPSSDGLKKSPAPKSQREKGKRPSGGQLGHKGETLEVVAAPDAVVIHALDCCPHCQHDLKQTAVERVSQRQVFELPPLRLLVTEHQAEQKRCPHCQRQASAAFPQGVQQLTQYGERFKGLLVYLSAYQLLPLRRITELTQDWFGQRVSEGTLERTLKQAAGAVAGVLAAVEQAWWTQPSPTRMKRVSGWQANSIGCMCCPHPD
jgi:transposase